MKKTTLFIVLALMLTFLSNTLAQQDREPAQIIGEQFNINQSKIPTSQEDIETIRQKFLQQQWTEVIAKNKILGPVHNFLIKISPFFQIIFAYKYEISLTLFLIVILWFLIATQVGNIVKSSGLVKGWIAFAIGIASAVILAQTRLLKLITTTLLDITFKQENWWIRLIIFILIFGAIIFLYVLAKIISQNIKKQKEEETKQESEAKLKEMKKMGSTIQKYK